MAKPASKRPRSGRRKSNNSARVSSLKARNTNQARETVHISKPSYQPNKKELDEIIKLDVPGETVQEKMDNLAKAIVQPVDVTYKD